MSKRVRRRQQPYIEADLEKKLVLVAGPRQCGKTTLARSVLDDFGGEYFSWDDGADRAALRAGRLDLDAPLWVFDELHKNRH